MYNDSFVEEAKKEIATLSEVIEEQVTELTKLRAENSRYKEIISKQAALLSRHGISAQDDD